MQYKANKIANKSFRETLSVDVSRDYGNNCEDTNDSFGKGELISPSYNKMILSLNNETEYNNVEKLLINDHNLKYKI